MAPSKWAQLSFRPSPTPSPTSTPRPSRGDRLGPGPRRPAARGAPREDGDDRAPAWRPCGSWHWAVWAGLGLIWVLVFTIQFLRANHAAPGCGWGSLLPCLLQAQRDARASSERGVGVGTGAASRGAPLDPTPPSGYGTGAEAVGGPRTAPAGPSASETSPEGLPHDVPAALGLPLGAGPGSAAGAGVAPGGEGVRQGTGGEVQGVGTWAGEVAGTGVGAGAGAGTWAGEVAETGTGAGAGTVPVAGASNGAGGTGTREVSQEDQELFERALAAQGTGQPRVALLFLVRGPLPLAPLWARFLAGHEAHFSVYIHATGGAPALDLHLPAAFQGRHVPSKGTKWGSMSIVDAERRVLGHALADPQNSHFVLLSESCIPLFDAGFTLRYLARARHSFVDTAQELAWWSRSMLPLVPESALRKGSAWFAMQRPHARLVVADRAFYQQFQAGWGFGHGYDEHYYQTVLAHHDPGGLANRSTTYALFKDGKAHPVTFTAQDVTPASLQGLASESCTWNGRWAAPCFLFARKFAPDALQPLLSLLPLTPSFQELTPEAAAAAASGASGPGQGRGPEEWAGAGAGDAEDEALFSRAVSRKPLGTQVALLFLTSGTLPLAPLWARFLAGSEDRFSIYIHAPPQALTDAALPHLFQGRHIPYKAPDGGTPASTLVAVKRLLAHALLDSRNSHFVLLSQWCAPLWDSEFTFNAIVESPHSFVDTAAAPVCWAPSLLPRIPREQLKRGSPWFVMLRKHAWLVLRDSSYFSALRNGWQCSQGAAEYYYQTLLPRMVAPQLANRSATYEPSQERGAGTEELVPRKIFEAADLSADLLSSIGARKCLGPGSVEMPCFLFATSFGPGTLQPLLQLLPLPMQPALVG